MELLVTGLLHEFLFSTIDLRGEESICDAYRSWWMPHVFSRDLKMKTVIMGELLPLSLLLMLMLMFWSRSIFFDFSELCIRFRPCSIHGFVTVRTEDFLKRVAAMRLEKAANTAGVPLYDARKYPVNVKAA